jgi:membrane protease YdiL (CAAX protease family)
MIPEIPPEPPPDSTQESQPKPESDPFWGYSDILIFVGLAIPSLLMGWGVVRFVFWAFRIHPAVATWELILDQFTGYLILFTGLWAIFRTQYGRPFWQSLGWVRTRLSLLQIVLAGVAAVFVVSLLGRLIQTPTTSNKMLELLQDRTSIVLVAVFGITFGPLCEELAFRGFLQPLLVRSLGTVVGIFAAAIPFGLLHLQEYNYSWRHVLLVSMAGVGFGWMRHITGSTKAAVIMHAVYNAIFFLVFVAQTKLPSK